MWKDHDTPAICAPYMHSWKHHHPDWEYRFWTDDDILELITEHYSWFLDTYNSYEHNIQRSDAARHVILHHHGGLYCDIDIECYKPTDDLFNDTCVLFEENPNDYSDILTNSICYAPKYCPFMLRCVKTLKIQHGSEQLPHECYGGYILRTTGPVFLDSVYHRWRHVLPVRRESHERFEYTVKTNRQSPDYCHEPNNKEYGMHHNMGSWY